MYLTSTRQVHALPQLERLSRGLPRPREEARSCRPRLTASTPRILHGVKEAAGVSNAMPQGAGRVRCLECGAEAVAAGDGSSIALKHGSTCSENAAATRQGRRGAWACGSHMEIPCTCTIACVPEGITDEQTCRLWLENGRSWDGCCCPSVPCPIHHEHLEDE